MPATRRKRKVHSTADRRAELEAVVRGRSAGASQGRRARILPLSDPDHPDGRRSDRRVAETVGMCACPVVRIRRKFVRDGLAPASDRRDRAPASAPPEIGGAAEAQLVALRGSTQPDGVAASAGRRFCIPERDRARVVARMDGASEEIRADAEPALPTAATADGRASARSPASSTRRPAGGG